MRGTQSRNGFSFTEIMFVVAVIGMLAAVAIPSALKARKTAHTEQAKLDLEMLASAISELAWDTGEWPRGIARNVQSSAESWSLTRGSAGLVANDGRFSDWQGPYIKSISVDPWGQPYFFDPDYRVNGEWRVVVGSFGPNCRGRNAYDADDIYILLK
ncbi:MAG: prepilin-type N-terminal cleavage/methylation domain-containing protein [Verrucomicrobia bacterium]|jgi:type II secretion system protein G|nr:prepilin-type N-terminal cleavage/methylation domain-containing protein [Verrucomicrobiota bacterium]MBT7701175.1 prepilin-type N-terminal cleavage/methylation domain-containing protein [Verrucomicrobiota bacterium]